MTVLRSQQVYDRSRILDAASRARARKQRRRAIELYRWVLAVEPQNVEIHARLAPLLAETRQGFDAWGSYKAVARALLRQGQPDKALAVYREATLKLPREDQAWLAVARLQHKRGNPRDALDTLVEGSRNFRSARLRSRAIQLLRTGRPGGALHRGTPAPGAGRPAEALAGPPGGLALAPGRLRGRLQPHRGGPQQLRGGALPPPQRPRPLSPGPGGRSSRLPELPIPRRSGEVRPCTAGSAIRG
jgi:pentatricopeptide repeat protein